MKFLKLPSPKELGWSKSDALGLKEMTPFQEGPFWEDWHDYCKKHYPVKYFLVETLPDFFKPIKWKLERAYYWLQCHLRPKKYNMYKLSLKGVDTLDYHSWGYLDPCNVMYLAGWASLRRYWEKGRKPTNLREHYSEEEIKENYSQQQEAYDEALLLYNYWMVDRAEEVATIYNLYKKYKEDQKKAVEANDKSLCEESQKAWLDYSHECEDRQQEMFMRLAALRPYLWK